jgi:hypothetical protein
MNLLYTADLLMDVLFRSGEPVDGTSEFASTALSYLNRAYFGIAAGGGELIPGMQEDWPWLRKDPPGVLNLFPLIAPSVAGSPASVEVTFNANAVNFSATIARSVAGAVLTIAGHADIFRVLAHTAGASVATLDAAYTGATNAAADYRLMTVEYALASDVLRVFSPMRVGRQTRNDRAYQIYGVDLDQLETEYPLATISAGVPSQFAMIGEQKVRFSHYASDVANDLTRVEYDYLQTPTPLTAPGVNEQPLVPQRWRRVLSDWATFWLLMDKNDDRADATGASAKSGLQAMADEQRRTLQGTDPDFGKIRPRRDYSSRWIMRTIGRW